MKLFLQSGRDVVLEMAEGKAVRLRSPTSAPPGSTLSLTTPNAPRPFQVKVRGCRRDQDGLFVIEGRWVNLSTGQRDALIRAGFQAI